MCVIVPCQVMACTEFTAQVRRGDAVLDVSLLLLDEAVAVGDWLAVQAQRHAVRRLAPAEAREILDLLARLEEEAAHAPG